MLPSTVRINRVSLEEQRRLDECSVEPIRTPGAVQSHGVLLVVTASDFTVIHASENAWDVLGVPAATLLGTSLADFIGAAPIEQFRQVLGTSPMANNPSPLGFRDRPFDVIVHQQGELVFVEFEPATLPTESQSPAALYGAIHRLAGTSTVDELWRETAREVQQITHFDRVMVYHFHEDDHGEVVAEEKAADMEPYLGLHYPASDIPAQARELYLTKPSRTVASSDSEVAGLLSAPGVPGETVESLDLGHTELRSVSPHHLQFMRNLGQASTLSVSMIHDGRLIGMITCAHRTPRRMPFVVRLGLEVLANQVSLQLSAIREIARLNRKMEARSVRGLVAAQITARDDIAAALVEDTVTILDVVPADGAVVRLRGVVTSLGNCPPMANVEALTKSVLPEQLGATFVSDTLPLDHPDLAAVIPGVAGVLVVPLGSEGDYIAWFRPEMTQTVHWLGDLSPANRLTPLSPRNSFSAWSQDVTGVSEPWSESGFEAAELGRDVEAALLRRAESTLAILALRDPLTALPNRRLLMDRLDHALTKYARGEEVALIFIDLDDFKSVNDSFGHAVGDGLLVSTAERLVATMRAQDTVARIGGDEFVVLCENTTIEEADLMAARIVRVLRQHVGPVDNQIEITASVGVSSANLSFGADDILRLADAAMYRAKSNGRDQVSR